MTCRDFEQRWQDWLDEPLAEPVDPDGAMEQHASACPPCAERRQRYRTLRLAIPGWAAHPVSPSAGFADRAVAAWAAEPQVLPMRAGPATWPHRWAAAAAVLLAVGLGGVRWAQGPTPVEPPTPVAVELAVTPDRPLSESLADLTSATIQLARATSASATRLGRDVIDSTTIALAPTAEPAAAPAAVEDEEEGVLLRQFGDGMRPISTPARRAFSFLLGPDDADRPPSNG